MDGANVQVGDDGNVIIRASALGACTKALVAARLEYSQERRSTSQMDEGQLHEDDVLARMEKAGWLIADRQREVSLSITKTITVLGHIDALGAGQLPDRIQFVDRYDGPFIVDVKSQSKDAWDAFEKYSWSSGFFPEYKWQMSAYMNSLALPAVLVRKNRNTGEIKYEHIPTPFYSIADIRRRVLEIESWAIRGELPESCDHKMFPCPVYYLHEDEKFVISDDSLIADLAIQHEEAKIAEKIAKEKKDTARKALREGMGLRLEDGKVVGDNMKVVANGVKVSFYNQKNSPSVNWDAVYDSLELTKEQFDESYKTQTEGERLRITLPKGTDDGTA